MRKQACSGVVLVATFIGSFGVRIEEHLELVELNFARPVLINLFYQPFNVDRHLELLLDCGN